MDAYLINEHIPPDDGRSQAAAIRVATDVIAAAVTRAVRAGMKSGRYVVIDRVIMLAKEKEPA